MKTSKQYATFCKRAIALFLLASLLLLAASCTKKEEKPTEGEAVAFDYENCDFDEYFTLDEKVYRNQTVEAPYPQYVTEKNIDEAVQSILIESGTPNYITDRAAKEGDTVNIYYKGVTTDKDGKETAFSGGTSMTFGRPSPLTLGSGQFIDGFEDGLIGIVPEDTFRYVSDDPDLTVLSDSLIHVTYEATYLEKGETKTKKATAVLENMADKTFGDEFATVMLGAKAGETRFFDTVYDINADKTKDTVSMKATVVDIAVLNPCTVNATFPTPYPNSPDLAGKTVKFYVWVESIVGENIPAELNEKFVTETMKIEVKEGEDALKVFREYVRKNLQDQRDANVKNVTLSQAWENLLDKAVFKKIPESEVKAQSEYLKEEVTYYFQSYGAYYGYDKLDDFAAFYFGVDKKDFKLDDYAAELAEKTVKQELIANYLIKKHSLGVDEQTVNKEAEEFFKEQASAANEQDSSANYTPESVREEIEKQYGEGYVEKMIRGEKNAERVQEFLLSNYTVTYTEESTEKPTEEATEK